MSSRRGPPSRGSATVELRDGTVLSYDMYGFMKEPGVFAKGMRRSRDGGKTFEGPLLAMVASPLSTAKFKYPDKCVERYKKTSAQWSPYCGGNFSGSAIELEDGTLLAYDRHDAFPELGGRKTTVIQGVYITVRRRPK